MDDNHIQHCIKYEFDRGSNYKIALKNIHDAYGNDSLSDSTCRQYYKKLRNVKNQDRKSSDELKENKTSEEKEINPESYFL